MAKARPESFCDFDATSTESWDQVSEMRNIQARLYELDNPYVGSKRGIIVDIYLALQKHDVQFDTVFDMFSGSGVVSLFFKLVGKNTVSNDLLSSSRDNAVAFVRNDKQLITREVLDRLCRDEISTFSNKFVQNWYGGKRFTDAESQFLDRYRGNIYNCASCMKTTGSPLEVEDFIASAFATINHYVLSRCFLGGRLNKGQVLAKLDHRLKHKRNDGDEMLFKLEPPPVFPNLHGTQHICLTGDIFDTLEKLRTSSIDLAYMDPPYGGDQSDYAEMFRFLEEYAFADRLENLPHIQKSKRFSSAKDYDLHFKELLDRSRQIPQWAISYNDSSWADIDTLRGIVGQFKKNVIVENISHKYKYRKNRSSATEYLIVAR